MPALCRAITRRFPSVVRARPFISHVRWFSSDKNKHNNYALVLNAGSSSIKYGLFDIKTDGQDGTLLCSGIVDSLGSENAKLKHNDALAGKQVSHEMSIPDHSTGLKKVVEILMEKDGAIREIDDIKVVGHRVVHGGNLFSGPTVINDDVIRAIEKCSTLAPLHNPANLVGIRIAKELFPAPHVAVFDTAFHTTMPPESYRYAIPKELYEEHGIRKYGFHGTSFTYVLGATAAALKRPIEDLNIIMLHLGSGASMACVKNGKGIDTTMGMTPLEGLVMGTRSGDIDPGIYTHLCTQLNMSPAEVDRMLNRRSGLLGLCGQNDMRGIISAASKGDADAKLARQIFVERIRKYLGAYLVKLNGELDAIVFTGGIGENDFALRESICEGLRSLGIELDTTKNLSGLSLVEVQGTFSRTKILVIPTNEELSIALQSADVAGVVSKLSGAEKLAQAQTEWQVPKAAEAEYDPSAPKLGNALFVEGTGMTAVEEVGLLYAVLPRAPRVGYFRPFAEGENDRSISLMRSIFRLDEAPEVMQGITVAEATKLLSHGQEKELFDQVLSKYVEYRKGKDFVLVSCGRLENDSHFWSQKMAAALNLPVLLISDLGHESDLAIIKGGLDSNNVKIAGVLMSGLPPGNEYADTANECKEAIEQLGLRSVGMLPKSAIIHQVTMAEVVDALGAKVFFGEESLDRSIVKDITVATLDMNRMLHRLRVHPARSSNYPRPAGILLTGSRNLDPDVDDILCGLNGIAMPVIGVEEDTFACTTTLLKHRPVLLPSSTTKIEAAQVLFQRHIDPKFLNQLVATNAEDYVVTPKLFQHNIFSVARSAKQRIVLPEGDDPRVLAAAGELLARNLCEVTILGKEDLIQNRAKRNHVSLKGVKIVDPETETTDEMVDALYNARKSKGMTKELARDMLQGEPNWFGTMMMYLDQADGMVSGACHSTAATMRPALQVIKMAPGFSLVSSVFFMLLPGRVLVFGDCAINVDPTADELAEIATASAQTARAFGILPRVAMLSYATGDSNQGPMIDKVREATKKARLLAPNELIEGPIQFDAAVDPAVAAVKYKGQDSPVAGKATVLVFPDLNAGNNAYKAVQQASKSIAVGPIMQGLRKPVNDLSRGCTIDDIVNTVVVTCLQSKASKELAKNK